MWPVAARGQECGHNGGQLDSYVMLGQIPSLPNNSLPRILFLSIFFFSRFVSSHNRKHIKLCRPMYLCRTRMPILKTVSNVYFKIKMNSEKPGPAVPLQYPRQGCTPCPAPASGKMVVHSCTIFLYFLVAWIVKYDIPYRDPNMNTRIIELGYRTR